MLVDLIHAGPILEPTFPKYLFRVLMHLVMFGGIAVLIRGVFTMTHLAKSAAALDSTDRSQD